MHNIQSSLLSMDTLSGEGVAPIPGLLLPHAPVLALAQAAATGVILTIIFLVMTASQADP